MIMVGMIMVGGYGWWLWLVVMVGGYGWWFHLYLRIRIVFTNGLLNSLVYIVVETGRL